MKGVQEKEVIMGVRGTYKNPSFAITVWHHSARLVMPDSDPPDGVFYLPDTPVIDSYNNITSVCHLRHCRFYPGCAFTDKQKNGTKEQKKDVLRLTQKRISFLSFFHLDWESSQKIWYTLIKLVDSIRQRPFYCFSHRISGINGSTWGEYNLGKTIDKIGIRSFLMCA